MNQVSDLFNDMADEYDDVKDPWYSWQLTRLHYLIVKNVIFPNKRLDVLDVGCGTGFQSFLHGMFGNQVVGIDISEEMINKAKENIRNWQNKTKVNIIPEYYSFVNKYNKLILKMHSKRQNQNRKNPEFRVANATKIPFKNSSFDHVNCVGSVLSFNPNYRKALHEMVRVLKPKGTLFLEIESRWNADTFWSFLDPLVKNKFGLNKSFTEGKRRLLTPFNQHLNTFFTINEGSEKLLMEYKLFTNYLIKQELQQFNLKILKHWTIHSITNIIPSSFLKPDSYPSDKLIYIFERLIQLEEHFPFQLPGFSLVYYCQKK